LFLVAAGFCFWEWELDGRGLNGIGATVFFIALIVGTLLYFVSNGIKQSVRSGILLGVAVAGALPFALCGPRGINVLLFMFEALVCLMWAACSCHSLLKRMLDGFVVVDLARHSLVVPFRHFGWMFLCLASLFGRLVRGKRARKAVLVGLVGLVATVPLLLCVIVLLSAADDGFYALVDHALVTLMALDPARLVEYAGELVIGLPVACYVFGATVGNVAQRLRPSWGGDQKTGGRLAQAHEVEQSVGRLRIVPPALFALPLGVFAFVYLVFFIAMGSYLFSALQGELPESLTYAQYARRGFFELCCVAAINLVIVAFVHLTVRRRHDGTEAGAGPGARGRIPRAICLVGGIVSLETCLLVVVAASKMLLYIDAYGLTRLRLYTIWFMLLLLAAFVLLTLWHMRRFNMARPLVAVACALTLALGLVNTDAIIAHYNVDRYLSGKTEEVDVQMLATGLPGAGLSPLMRLQDEAPDSDVRLKAAAVIREKNKADAKDELPWYRWSLVRLP
jgi:hypothetical protein